MVEVHVGAHAVAHGAAKLATDRIVPVLATFAPVADAEGRIVASGGRVLNVTAVGDTVTAAQKAAYEAVEKIGFLTGFCRRDIGWREVEREERD